MSTLYIRYSANSGGVPSFPLLAPDGTAGAPSYSFTNSPNSGMYSPGTNQVAFSTNSTQALLINASQNSTFAGTLTVKNPVGIGSISATDTGLYVIPQQFTTALSASTQYGILVSASQGTSGTTLYGIYSDANSSANSYTVANLNKFYASNVTKGAGSTITRQVQYGGAIPSQGTNNAFLADNVAFTGSWGINLSSTNQSTFGGNVICNGTLYSGNTTAVNTNTGIQSFQQVTASANSNVGIFSREDITGNVSLGTNVFNSGVYVVLNRFTSANTTESTAFLNAGLFELNINPSAATTYTNSNEVNTLQVRAGGLAGAGTMSIALWNGLRFADSTTGSSGTGFTRKNHIYFGASSAGTNNSYITDNQSFTGNWGINLTSTNPNLLTGATAIGGTATNNDAAAGFVGEAVVSRVSTLTNVPGATGVWANLTTISLTAGDWDVTGVVTLESNGTTFSALDEVIAVSINSGTTTTDHVIGDNVFGLAATNTTSVQRSGVVSNYRLSLSATTTVYLKGNFNYSVATPQYVCRLSARRMR